MSKKMDFREYECELIKVVDGDTIDCWIDLGFKTKLKKRVRYIFSFGALIDAVAILPSLIALFYPSIDLRFVRALRIVRLLKFSRYSGSINSLISVLWDQRRSFGAAFFLLFIALAKSYQLVTPELHQ